MMTTRYIPIPFVRAIKRNHPLDDPPISYLPALKTYSHICTYPRCSNGMSRVPHVQIMMSRLTKRGRPGDYSVHRFFDRTTLI